MRGLCTPDILLGAIFTRSFSAGEKRTRKLYWNELNAKIHDKRIPFLFKENIAHRKAYFEEKTQTRCATILETEIKFTS